MVDAEKKKHLLPATLHFSLVCQKRQGPNKRELIL